MNMWQNDLNDTMSKLVGILNAEKCSCVILTDEKITVCHERGIKDLYRILHDMPELLENASIADKVIGKGAAALMALGKVKEIYADVISQPAIDLLATVEIFVVYGTLVPNIINRTGTGLCPVETLCKEAMTPEQCLTLITDFINRINNTK